MIDGHQTVLINFADPGFADAQRQNTWTGKYLGRFDRVIAYAPGDIDRDFFETYRDILEMKRGAGEWLWKPYFILRTLEAMNTGDFLFYCDAGAMMLRPCRLLFDSMKDCDLWVSDIPLIERQWTKPEVFRRLGVSGREEIINSNQIQGGFIGVRKSPSSVEFIKEWLSFCCDRELLLPLTSEEEKGDCLAHREDQSILSILCKRSGIRPHRDPTQFGRIPEKYRGWEAEYNVPSHPEDEYPTLILLHRSGNCDARVVLRQWLNIVLPKRLVLRLIR